MIDRLELQAAQEIDHKLDCSGSDLYLLYAPFTNSYTTQELWIVAEAAGVVVEEYGNLSDIANSEIEEVADAMAYVTETLHQKERTIFDDVLFDTTNQILRSGSVEKVAEFMEEIGQWEYMIAYQIRQDLWAIVSDNDNEIVNCYQTLWELEKDDHWGIIIDGEDPYDDGWEEE